MVGKWKGTYRYSSKRIPEEIRNREVKFEMEICDFDGTVFTGTIHDDVETGGMRGVGRISGTIRNGKVEFVKEMPMQAVYLPDGSKVEENKPHRKIYYAGSLVDNHAEGRWKFKWGIGKVQNRWAIFPRSTGTWNMKKM